MKKKHQITLLYFLFYLSFFILISYKIVETNNRGKLYNDVDAIPTNKVGLLLGASKYLKSGYINLYYKYRIDATAALFHAGKVNYIIVSGDNSSKAYDEPTAMQKDLIAKGIPAKSIYLDYAGFRTFDSVVRSKEIFGQSSITIISQPFHNKRALFIAGQKGINAVAYNAKEVSSNYGFKTNLREILARSKMVLDFLFGKQPKFLGKKIQIP